MQVVSTGSCLIILGLFQTLHSLASYRVSDLHNPHSDSSSLLYGRKDAIPEEDTAEHFLLHPFRWGGRFTCTTDLPFAHALTTHFKRPLVGKLQVNIHIYIINGATFDSSVSPIISPVCSRYVCVCLTRALNRACQLYHSQNYVFKKTKPREILNDKTLGNKYALWHLSVWMTCVGQ